MQKYPLVILITLTTLLWHSYSYAAAQTGRVNIYRGMRRAVQVTVEVADTYKKRQRGLMQRDTLEEKEGMLFIFKDNEKGWSIWMKNILIPLDIIFISKELRVINYVKGAEPCKASQCTDYYPERPARYVLEVNAGFIERYGVEVGSLIEITQ